MVASGAALNADMLCAAFVHVDHEISHKPVSSGCLDVFKTDIFLRSIGR